MKSVTGLETGTIYKIATDFSSELHDDYISLENGRYILKLLNTKDKKIKNLDKMISYIKKRSIQDLNIAKPIECITGDEPGYIMKVKPNMVILNTLLKSDFDIDWWKDTGGLKKRLDILYNLSQLLSDLHARGLSYGNLSPESILISKEDSLAEVFLINIENITHKSKISDNSFESKYCAPEIIKGISSNDTYTDNYSFSLLAYQLLTLNHPFVGDYVNNNNKLEKKAYLGEIPWIEHSSALQNKASSGLQSSMTISETMMNEFRNTFETNIYNKSKRTSIYKWNKVIEDSIAKLLTCSSCDNTYFYNTELQCPFCRYQEQSIGIIDILGLNAVIKNELQENYKQINLKSIQDKGHGVSKKIEALNRYISITENDLYLNNSNNIILKIKISEHYNFIKGVSKKMITVFAKNKIKENINIEKETKISQGDWLIFSKELDSKYQRVITARKYNR